MTDLNTLERHAFIRGDTALADIYDRAAMFDGIGIDTLNEVANIGLDKIKKTEYKRGKRDASNHELLEEIARLKVDLEQTQKNFDELLTAFVALVAWIKSDDAKTITNRKRTSQRLESWLRKWRTP